MYAIRSYYGNLERALRVAMHSRNLVKVWRSELGLEYDHKSKGILNFYRDPREFEAACKSNAAMNAKGLDREVKTPDECLALEPALETVRPELVGGIYSPSDESGDAWKFTRITSYNVCYTKLLRKSTPTSGQPRGS